MWRPIPILRVVLVLALAQTSGCAQLKLALHQPEASKVAHGSSTDTPRVMLARFQDLPGPQARESAREQDATTEKPTSTADVPAPVDEDVQAAGSAPPIESMQIVTQSYTAPGLAYQQLAVAVTAVAVSTVADDSDEFGRELSESIALADTGAAGRLGLTATPTRVAGRVTSRPGLQEGPVTGLGFAAIDRNIFVPQMNRLSGPRGRCHELARSGFFGGSRTACERSFRR